MGKGFIFLSFIFYTLGLQAQEQENNISLIDYVNRGKHACYIVRVPVSATKIKYYEEKIAQLGLANEVRQRYEKDLSETLQENKTFIHLIQASFTAHFSLGNVYFLPDSSYKSFVAGQQTGFINQTGALDKSITCPHAENYFLISGKHKEQLLFLDQHLHKLDPPFPYKKNTFLPIFKLVLNRKGYIDTQVKYFDSKLNPSITIR
jgi:hypothetical protein